MNGDRRVERLEELWLRHLAVQGLLAKSPLHKPQPALFSPRLREGHSWILE